VTTFNKLNRKVHYWVSIVVAVPLLIVVCSGLLLQLKKHSAWIQPPELQGTVTTPAVSFDQILASLQRAPDLDVRTWSDISRLDVRPRRGLVKVLLRNGWEAQVDLGTGEVLQVAFRRSDIIEAIHDGSLFAGNWSKFGLFLPAGVGLLVLLCGGLWMFWLPVLTKARQRKRTTEPVANAGAHAIPIPSAEEL
jgi:uncharacterized iron-regulated membrane protein